MNNLKKGVLTVGAAAVLSGCGGSRGTDIEKDSIDLDIKSPNIHCAVGEETYSTTEQICEKVNGTVLNNSKFTITFPDNNNSVKDDSVDNSNQNDTPRIGLLPNEYRIMKKEDIILDEIESQNFDFYNFITTNYPNFDEVKTTISDTEVIIEIIKNRDLDVPIKTIQKIILTQISEEEVNNIRDDINNNSIVYDNISCSFPEIEPTDYLIEADYDFQTPVILAENEKFNPSDYLLNKPEYKNLCIVGYKLVDNILKVVIEKDNKYFLVNDDINFLNN